MSHYQKRPGKVSRFCCIFVFFPSIQKETFARPMHHKTCQTTPSSRVKRMQFSTLAANVRDTRINIGDSSLTKECYMRLTSAQWRISHCRAPQTSELLLLPLDCQLPNLTTDGTLTKSLYAPQKCTVNVCSLDWEDTQKGSHHYSSPDIRSRDNSPQSRTTFRSETRGQPVKKIVAGLSVAVLIIRQHINLYDAWKIT